MEITLKIAIIGAIAVIIGALIKLLGDLVNKGSSGGLVFTMIILILAVIGGGVFVLNLPTPTPESIETTLPDNVPETSFSGTWQGNDPDDNSTISLILTQTGDHVEGTFSDTFSKQADGALIRPGYWGQGSGNVITSTEAKMSFDLTRSDGASIHLDIRLILSLENTTLTLEVPQSSSIVLRRQQ
ncbi:MAG: hypothetical protein HS100_11125 [Anaerolineales bacterium]|nr:hypothetical protein [Anaerolineales bacterium]